MGGGHSLALLNTSYARIESTTPLGTNYGGGVWAGGIWRIQSGSSSRLDVLGGEIGELDVDDYAHAWLYGGVIKTLQTGQLTPQIDLFCKSYNFNAATKVLTGVWGDDSVFGIQLVNSPNPLHTPTFDNINFHIVPEPMTLGLLGLGGLWLRRRMA
jgi:hypothetical protein